ncbi:flagellar hook-length control protein FliK [Devosia honganensis]|uniref:Flagellar hook-length control protein FliK n=1 Tax=Devosia honganensis TaxID=1610527 RepID=A0ABV7WYY0_9HYPH
MASHLIVISSGSAARLFGGPPPAHQQADKAPAALPGMFAALIEDMAAGKDGSGAADIGVVLPPGQDGGADGNPDADPLAAALSAPVAPAAAPEPQPMVDFVDALAALRAGLERGEPLDPELLARVEAALSGLAEALGLDIDALPVPDDFAALLARTDKEAPGLAGTLMRLLDPLARSLDAARPATGEETALLKTLGDRLGALLAALEDGPVSAERLAALGMAPGQSLDAEIEAALARFAASAAPMAAVPEEPTLAAPALKLTEPVLAGREKNAPEDAPGPVQTPETGRDDKPARAEPPARERTASAPPAARDASAAPAPAADAQAVAQAARVDAAANPRIVQAGYQTSQQQLNLPQIAFELARQVQDGSTRFQIRLDPPELGRIEVRLDIDHAGKVSARLMVEKSETLDLMQRDQRGLERALQQAGLDAGKTSLEFSLKQNPFAGQRDQFGRGREGGADGPAAGEPGPAEQEAAPTVNLYRGALQASGVNIIA